MNTMVTPVISVEPTSGTGKKYPRCLRFGIPSLDSLIGDHISERLSEDHAEIKEDVERKDPIRQSDDYGIKLNNSDAVTICLAGTSGTGKSIIALHLAARYAADTFQALQPNAPPNPKIIYVSTDYTGAQVREMWGEFGLEDVTKPNRNPPEEGQEVQGHGIDNEPFWGLDSPISPALRTASPLKILLVDGFCPQDAPDILTKSTEEILQERRKKPTDLKGGETGNTGIVHFVDLQTNTAGDDWQFLNNLLLQLPKPQLGDSPNKHLLIIDAIEGLEALTGTHDSFGQERKRRSRITQLIRSASQTCHLVFVIEGGIDKDTPEQYAADIVLRLRSDEGGRQGYLRRTVEVEKARGHAHARGQHNLQIRKGKRASTTGQQMHYDDPQTPYSYVHVIPSLSLVARETMWHRAKELPKPDTEHVADFGIPYLDDMLRESKTKNAAVPPRGLPAGSVTALTGDDGTQKSALLREFAIAHFKTAADIIFGTITRTVENWFASPRHLVKTTQMTKTEIETEKAEIRGKLYTRTILKDLCEDVRATVYFTTQDIDNYYLANAAMKRITDDPESWYKSDGTRGVYNKSKYDTIKLVSEPLAIEMLAHLIICRRLERSEVPPSTLFQIIRSGVRQAMNLVARSRTGSDNPTTWVNSDNFNSTDVRKEEIGWRIRVVIEDWQTIRDNYPDVRHDDLFLGFTMFWLRRQGVTTLIGHTRAGQPDADPEQDDNRLQTEADFNLRTWRIHFGERDRIAITAIPSIATDRPSQVREIRWETGVEGKKDKIVVDPILELYQGIREGNPTLTPLRIRFNAESKSLVRYSKRLEQLLQEMFPSKEKPDIRVFCDETEEGGSQSSYEHLRDLTHFSRNHPLDHALVFMVDEFWSLADEGKPSLLGNLTDYLNQATYEDGKQNSIADPIGVFQPSQNFQTETIFRRSLFLDLGESVSEKDEGVLENEGNRWDRIPFFQNFGFLLCHENLWIEAQNAKLTFKGKSCHHTVKDVWSPLARSSEHRSKEVKETGEGGGEESPIAQSSEHSGIDNVPSYCQPPVSHLPEPPAVSWRMFLEACTLVHGYKSQSHKPYAPFDASRHSLESLSCLVLEIWASEIYRDKWDKNPMEAEEWAKRLSERKWHQDKKSEESLISWLVGSETSNASLRGSLDHGECPGYTNALYRSLQILSEVLTWEGLSREDNPFDDDLPKHDVMATPKAVASRVWYTTASLQQGILPQFRKPDEKDMATFNEKDPLVMLRLPGRFTVRGDWYLAIAPNSSSRRLAERALDVMSSFTNNIERLEQGVGLPVRIGNKNSDFRKHHLDRYKAMRTPLVTFRYYKTPEKFAAVPARYEDMMKLMPPEGEAEGKPKFGYLWRSSLKNYDRHARIFQRWIRRELEYFVSHRERLGSKWESCFALYDHIREHYMASPLDNEAKGGLMHRRLFDALHPEKPKDKDEYPDTWKRFADRTQSLLDALKGATAPDP